MIRSTIAHRQLWIRTLLSCLFLVTLISGCSGKRPGLAAGIDSEQQAYSLAQKFLRARNFQSAIEVYAQMEAQFPFGRFAQQAQIENIYAHYMSGQGEGAVAAADRFIRLYPGHRKVDYAYYLRGLAAFTQSHTPIRLFFLRDLSDRDANSSRESFHYFQELVKLFPNSEYSPDARQRMIYLRNLLAHRELKIGRYYLARKAYAAAANRGRHVLENYSQTPAVVGGLTLMIDSYLYLNMMDRAADAVRVLRVNDPDHPNFADNGAYKPSKNPEDLNQSLLSLFSFGLLARPDIPPPILITTEEDGRQVE